MTDLKFSGIVTREKRHGSAVALIGGQDVVYQTYRKWFDRTLIVTIWLGQEIFSGELDVWHGTEEYRPSLDVWDAHRGTYHDILQLLLDREGEAIDLWITDEPINPSDLVVTP